MVGLWAEFVNLFQIRKRISSSKAKSSSFPFLCYETEPSFNWSRKFWQPNIVLRWNHGKSLSLRDKRLRCNQGSVPPWHFRQDPFLSIKLHIFFQLCHTRVLWCGIILGLFFFFASFFPMAWPAQVCDDALYSCPLSLTHLWASCALLSGHSQLLCNISIATVLRKRK